MIRPALSLAALAVVAPATAAPADDRAPGFSAVQVAQLTIRRRVIIRVPVGRVAIPAPIRWKEGKGPKCVAAPLLAGAAVTTANTIDLVLAGGARLRAQLDGDCAPLDFYSGFYLRPADDGQICAGRDTIRVRSGASCPIRRFRTLTARP